MLIGTEIFTRLPLDKKEIAQFILEICSTSLNKKLSGVDLAECYGNPQLQKVFGDLQNRFNLEIDTKFGHKFIEGKKYPKFNPSDVMEQVKNSYQFIPKIRTLYFHSGENSEFLNEDLWDFLNNELKLNRIRHLGLSIQNRLLEQNSLEQIEMASKFNIDVLQIPLNPMHKYALNRAIPMAQGNGMFIISRLILAKGDLLKLDLSELKDLCSLNLSLSRIESDLRNEFKIVKNDEKIERYLKLALTFIWTLTHTNAFTIASRNLEQFHMNTKILQLVVQRGYLNQ